MKEKITIEEFNKELHYDRDSGVFTRVLAKAGIGCGIAGSVNVDGYVLIVLNGKREYAHRLAWLLEHGEFPKLQIDHINGCKSDNRICNLREVSAQENAKNRPKDSNNINENVGVRFRRDTSKWTASIHVEGTKVNLGCFINYSDALNARKNAEVLYGFHTNHGRG